MMADYHLTTIFCDDIRQEINGKFTLVGCYNSQLLVSDFPFTLPRLAIHFILECEDESPAPAGDITLQVFQDEREIFRVDADIPVADAAATAGLPKRFNGGFNFGPISLEGDSIIRFELTLPSKEILRATPLHIAKRP